MQPVKQLAVVILSLREVSVEDVTFLSTLKTETFTNKKISGLSIQTKKIDNDVATSNASIDWEALYIHVHYLKILLKILFHFPDTETQVTKNTQKQRKLLWMELKYFSNKKFPELGRSRFPKKKQKQVKTKL